MNSVEPISIGPVSVSTAEINNQAVDIRKILVSLRWYSFKKPFVVKLSQGDELNLSLGLRRNPLPAGWKIKVHEQLTTCPECRKRVNAINRNFIGRAAPEVSELYGWLKDIVEVHALSHPRSSALPSSEETASGVIKVSRPEDKSGARVKFLPAKEEAIEVSPPPSTLRARIKFSEPLVVRPSHTPERSPAPGTRRTEEAARVVPAVDYELSGGPTVEVVIPANICNALVQHCRASLEHGNEVGGVLVGTKEEERGPSGRVDRYYVRATNLIQFRVADSSGSRLYLTPDSWAYVSNIEAEAGYEAQGKVRLGWYHTHPNQGIFFSIHDSDFHTVFSNEFQFALVVDPRKMEAGLFYWDSHARRLLRGPTTFPLIQDREVSPTLAVVSDDEKVAPRGGFAVRRLLFFAAAVLLAIVIISGGTLNYFKPLDIVILSLMASLALGLWNAHWFHPTHPSELVLVTLVEKWINDAKNPSEKRERVGSRRPSLVGLVIIIAVIAVIAITFFSRLKSQRVSPSNSGESQQTVNPVPAGSPSAHVSNETREFILRRDLANNLTLQTSGSALAISYKSTGSTWKCDALDEQEFFQQVLRWDLTEGVAQPYIRDVQIKLGGGNPLQYDGKWGPNTRAMLLSKLKSLASSKGTFDLLLPDNRKVIINVLGQPVDDSLGTDYSAPKSTPNPAASKARSTNPVAAPRPTVTRPAPQTPSSGNANNNDTPKTPGPSPQPVEPPPDNRLLGQTILGSTR